MTGHTDGGTDRHHSTAPCSLLWKQPVLLAAGQSPPLARLAVPIATCIQQHQCTKTTKFGRHDNVVEGSKELILVWPKSQPQFYKSWKFGEDRSGRCWDNWYDRTTTTTTVLRPLHSSNCISRHLQLTTGGFCWCSKVLLPASSCWLHALTERTPVYRPFVRDYPGKPVPER